MQIQTYQLQVQSIGVYSPVADLEAEDFDTWMISTEVNPLLAETRCLVRSLFRADSAIPALSSASSSSCTVFLYFAMLWLACSSWGHEKIWLFNFFFFKESLY